jgi:RNA polymerase sigma factor (sigma-70 family)
VTPVERAVAEAHRREWAAVLAATVRATRDLDLAEECVQDAFVDALGAWTRSGVPTRPGAWLTTAARHNALDALRRAGTLRSKLHLLVEPEVRPADGPTHPGDPVVRDDRLRLVFLCCHPALAVEAQVALTLRLVCGVTTRDIASAFLVPEATMAARITRAKKKITAARIPFRMPAASELPDRLDAVLAAIYLPPTCRRPRTTAEEPPPPRRARHASRPRPCWATHRGIRSTARSERHRRPCHAGRSECARDSSAWTSNCYSAASASPTTSRLVRARDPPASPGCSSSSSMNVVRSEGSRCGPWAAPPARLANRAV